MKRPSMNPADDDRCYARRAAAAVLAHGQSGKKLRRKHRWTPPGPSRFLREVQAQLCDDEGSVWVDVTITNMHRLADATGYLRARWMLEEAEEKAKEEAGEELHTTSWLQGLGRKVCNGVLSLITPQPKMFLGADGLPLPETPPLIEIPPLLCDSDTHTVPPGGFKKREEALPLCQQGHHFIEDAVRQHAADLRRLPTPLRLTALLHGCSTHSAEQVQRAPPGQLMSPTAAQRTGAAFLVTWAARIVAAKHVRAAMLQRLPMPLHLSTPEAVRLAALLHSCSTHSAEKAPQGRLMAILLTLAARIVAAKRVRAAVLRRLAGPLLLRLLWPQPQLQPNDCSAETATSPILQGPNSSAAAHAGPAAAGSARALQPAAPRTLQMTIRGIIAGALRWIMQRFAAFKTRATCHQQHQVQAAEDSRLGLPNSDISNTVPSALHGAYQAWAPLEPDNASKHMQNALHEAAQGATSAEADTALRQSVQRQAALTRGDPSDLDAWLLDSAPTGWHMPLEHKLRLLLRAHSLLQAQHAAAMTGSARQADSSLKADHRLWPQAPGHSLSSLPDPSPGHSNSQAALAAIRRLISGTARRAQHCARTLSSFILGWLP